MTRRGRPVLAAYSDTGALDVDCPTCDSKRSQWCTREDGRVRRIPCWERSVAGTALTMGARPRDLTEPIHPPQEGPAA